MAGSKFDGSGIVGCKSENGGTNWKDITGDLNSPDGSLISSLAIGGNGNLPVGVNDLQLQAWHKGKVFVTSNDGASWKEIDFGQTEDRFMHSIFINPYDNKELWIAEYQLYNDMIPQPLLYKSSDSGESFVSLTLPSNKMTAAGFENIAIHPNDESIIYLPLGGKNWQLKNHGIIGKGINLLAASHKDPSNSYTTSSGGEGVFRSTDYGESWFRLNEGGYSSFVGEKELIYSFEPGDLRDEVVNVYYVIDELEEEQLLDESNAGYWWPGMAFPQVNKYLTDEDDYDFPPSGNASRTNCPLFRFAEVLAIYAKTVIESNGPTPEAIEAFNRVRRRAGKAQPVPHSLSGDTKGPESHAEPGILGSV